MKNFSCRLIQLCLSIAFTTTLLSHNNTIASAAPNPETEATRQLENYQELEELKARIEALESQQSADRKTYIVKEKLEFPGKLFPNLSWGASFFSILTSLGAAGAATYLALAIDKRHSNSTNKITRNVSDLRQRLSGQLSEIKNLSLKIESYSQQINGLRQEWKADIRQSHFSSSTSVSSTPSDWSTACIAGDPMNLPPGFRQTDTAQAVSLQEQIKREFGKSSTYFTSDRFQPMRARNAWQIVVNNAGISTLELEDCQAYEGGYLRFSDANQDYLIPNATSPRLKQQILQLEQENNSAFQILISLTGELKLHQAAKIARNGADGWSVIEPGIIER